MAVRDAVMADFNAPSRHLKCKIELTEAVSGLAVTYTNEDRLISFRLLEEVGTDAINKIFGQISANMFDFVIYNIADDLNTENVSSPFHNVSISDIVVKPYLSLENDVDTINWVPLGSYRVVGWTPNTKHNTVAIIAYDAITSVLSAPGLTSVLYKDTTYNALISSLLSACGVLYSIDSPLDAVVPYAYYDSVAEDLNELVSATFSMCACKHDGIIHVKDLVNDEAVLITITDADQAKYYEPKLSGIKAHEGAEVEYFLPHIQKSVEVMNLQAVSLLTGENTLSNLSYSKTPVKAVNTVAIETTVDGVDVDSFQSTASKLDLVITAPSDIVTDIKVYGSVIESTKATVSTGSSNVLRHSNKYLQTKPHAETYIGTLNNYTTCSMPVLNLSIRGNPLIEIGDKIRVTSLKYNIDLVGIVYRLNYTYNGGLSCLMTLINTAAL